MEKRCIITTKIKYVNWEKILLLLISYGALLWGSGQIINIIQIPLEDNPFEDAKFIIDPKVADNYVLYRDTKET